MAKFNASILNRLKMMGFFNKSVTKIVTILSKYFFLYLNPTSYLNISLNLISYIPSLQDVDRFLILPTSPI